MMHPSNIASHLPTIAKLQPDTLAVAVQKSGQQYTYRQLDEASDAIANGLLKAGIGKGVRIVLMVTPGLDFFALVFALFKIGPAKQSTGKVCFPATDKDLRFCLCQTFAQIFYPHARVDCYHDCANFE